MGHFAKSPCPIAPKPSVQNVHQSTFTHNTCSAYIIEAMLRGMEPFGHLVCSEMARRMVRNRHFTPTSSRCKYFASLDLQCCSCELGGHRRSKWGLGCRVPGSAVGSQAPCTPRHWECNGILGTVQGAGCYNKPRSHYTPKHPAHLLSDEASELGARE